MTAISTAAVRHGSLPPATPTGHRFAPTAVPLGLAALAEAITDRTATVAVVGFGYVGLPLLVTAGAEGFRLIGIDTDGDKVRGLRSGRSHVADIFPEDLHWDADDITWDGRAQFSTDPCLLVAADVIVVAVPIPLRDGTPDLSLVRAAMEAVARALRPATAGPTTWCSSDLPTSPARCGLSGTSWGWREAPPPPPRRRADTGSSGSRAVERGAHRHERLGQLADEGALARQKNRRRRGLAADFLIS
jgi:hypothetical protein